MKRLLQAFLVLLLLVGLFFMLRGCSGGEDGFFDISEEERMRLIEENQRRRAERAARNPRPEDNRSSADKFRDLLNEAEVNTLNEDMLDIHRAL